MHAYGQLNEDLTLITWPDGSNPRFNLYLKFQAERLSSDFNKERKTKPNQIDIKFCSSMLIGTESKVKPILMYPKLNKQNY